MADEIKSQGGAGSSEPAKPQTIQVDGRTLTESDIRSLQTGNMLEADYRRKTMALAEERRQLEAARQTIEKEKQQLNTSRTSTTGTKPNAAGSVEDDDGLVDPNVKRLSQSVKEVSESVVTLATAVQEDRKKRDESAALATQERFKTDCDKLFEEMDTLVDTKFPLASKNGVAAQIHSFWTTNGRLPTSAEMGTMVTGSHQEVAGRGATITKVVGEKTENGSTKPSVVAAASPPTRTGLPHRLSDDGKMEAGLKAFLRDRGLTEE